MLDDTAQSKLDKVDAMLARTSTPKQDAALFAEMLSLPNDGRHPTLDLTPELRRQRTLEALGSKLEMQARQKPVLMIVEDAHWIDPTSLEALGYVIDRVHNVQMLVIVTYRPEFNPPWVARPYVMLLAINRLGKREIGMMIDALIGNKPLSVDIREDIIERTDGVPLFVEEMTKAVLEQEVRARHSGQLLRFRHRRCGPCKPSGIVDGTARPNSAPPRRWHRSAQLLGASSLILCWWRWPKSQRMI